MQRARSYEWGPTTSLAAHEYFCSDIAWRPAPIDDVSFRIGSPDIAVPEVVDVGAIPLSRGAQTPPWWLADGAAGGREREPWGGLSGAAWSSNSNYPALHTA